MRRGTNDALLSMGALVLLLIGLVSIDDRVRDRVERLLTAPPSSAEIVHVGNDIENVSAVMYSAARHHSIEHAPLVIFGAAAAILVLFMLRT